MTAQQVRQIYLDLIATLEKSQAIKYHDNTQALIVSFKFRVKELEQEIALEK